MAKQNKKWWKEYHAFLLSDEWKHIRHQKLYESGGRCEHCNVTFVLQVHHRNYYRVGGAELMSDLQVLCVDCHKGLHEGKKARTKPTKKASKRMMYAGAAIARRERIAATIERNDQNRECYGIKAKYPPGVANVPPAM